MFAKPLRWLDRAANWKTIGLLLIAVLLFTFVFFPARSKPLREQTGGGVSPILDTRFSYSPAVAYGLIGELDETGRRQYALSELSLDLLFPIAYSLLFSLLILALFRRAFPDVPAARKLALLPFAMLLADYAENFSLAVLLLRYPQQLPGLVRLASLFTTLKWLFGAVLVLLIFVGLPAALISGGGRKVKPQRRKA